MIRRHPSAKEGHTKEELETRSEEVEEVEIMTGLANFVFER